MPDEMPDDKPPIRLRDPYEIQRVHDMLAAALSEEVPSPPEFSDPLFIPLADVVNAQMDVLCWLLQCECDGETPFAANIRRLQEFFDANDIVAFDPDRPHRANVVDTAMILEALIRERERDERHSPGPGDRDEPGPDQPPSEPKPGYGKPRHPRIDRRGR